MLKLGALTMEMNHILHLVKIHLLNASQNRKAQNRKQCFYIILYLIYYIDDRAINHCYKRFANANKHQPDDSKQNIEQMMLQQAKESAANRLVAPKLGLKDRGSDYSKDVAVYKQSPKKLAIESNGDVKYATLRAFFAVPAVNKTFQDAPLRKQWLDEFEHKLIPYEDLTGYLHDNLKYEGFNAETVVPYILRSISSAPGGRLKKTDADKAPPTWKTLRRFIKEWMKYASKILVDTNKYTKRWGATQVIYVFFQRWYILARIGIILRVRSYLVKKRFKFYSGKATNSGEQPIYDEYKKNYYDVFRESKSSRSIRDVLDACDVLHANETKQYAPKKFKQSSPASSQLHADMTNARSHTQTRQSPPPPSQKSGSQHDVNIDDEKAETESKRPGCTQKNGVNDDQSELPLYGFEFVDNDNAEVPDARYSDSDNVNIEIASQTNASTYNA